jgi:PhnB protein
MLADEFADMNILGPRSIGATPVTINVYVEDVDSVHVRALAQGAKEIRPVENQFYGDRSGHYEDPFGHRWNVSRMCLQTKCRSGPKSRWRQWAPSPPVAIMAL